MALATVNLALEDDFVEKIDLFAKNEAITRTDLIYNSIKMYINRKQKLQELFAYGEQVAKKMSLPKRMYLTKYKKLEIVKPSDYLNLMTI